MATEHHPVTLEEAQVALAALARHMGPDRLSPQVHQGLEAAVGRRHTANMVVREALERHYPGEHLPVRREAAVVGLLKRKHLIADGPQGQVLMADLVEALMALGAELAGEEERHRVTLQGREALVQLLEENRVAVPIRLLSNLGPRGDEHKRPVA